VLLREKIFAAHRTADRIAESMVETPRPLPLPVEVNPFGLSATRRAMDVAVLRKAAFPGRWCFEKQRRHAFVTDGGHWIVVPTRTNNDDNPCSTTPVSSSRPRRGHRYFVRDGIDNPVRPS